MDSTLDNIIDSRPAKSNSVNHTGVRVYALLKAIRGMSHVSPRYPRYSSYIEITPDTPDTWKVAILE